MQFSDLEIGTKKERQVLKAHLTEEIKKFCNLASAKFLGIVCTVLFAPYDETNKENFPSVT